MQARLHQFGILASIGATPRQIRTCLLQEAAALALAPLLLGLLLGFCACFGALAAVNAAAADCSRAACSNLSAASPGRGRAGSGRLWHRVGVSLASGAPFEPDVPAGSAGGTALPPAPPGAQSDIHRHGCCDCGLAYAGELPAALCAPRKSPCGSPMFRCSYPFWASRRCFASLHCQASVPT